MPDLWASMRSMAKKVLPVLVGPSTAVTLGAGAERAPVVCMTSRLCFAAACARKMVRPLCAVLHPNARSGHGMHHTPSGLAVDAALKNSTKLEHNGLESLTNSISAFVLIHLA